MARRFQILASLGLLLVPAVAAASEGTAIDARPALAAVFLAIGLYHLVLWFRLREFKEYLWFGVVALCLSLNALLVAVGPEGFGPWEVMHQRLLSVDFHLTGAMFPLFLWAMLGHRMHWAVRALVGLHLALIPVAALTPGTSLYLPLRTPRLLTMVPLAVVCFGFAAREGWRGNPEARRLAVTGLPLFLAVMRDRIVQLSDPDAAGWSSFGFATFVVGMALVLADRFGRTHSGLVRSERQLQSMIVATQRFVPNAFLDLLGRRDVRDVEPGEGVEREMTVLFCDIRGFTTLTEKLGPRESFAFVNAYLAHLVPCVEAAGGFVDKYIGDAIMALFPTTPADGLRAAQTMLQALETFNAERAADNEPPVGIGIGLNSGPCILGTVGGPRRMEGTVISDAVNLAARLEGLTKTYGTPIVLSAFTAAALDRSVELRELDTVVVKGKTEPVAIFEALAALPEDTRALRRRSLPHFQAGLSALRAGRWHEATVHFAECLAVDSDDRAARLHLHTAQSELGQTEAAR